MLQGDFQDNYRNFCIVIMDYRRMVVVDPRYFYGNINDIIGSNGISDVLFLYNANTFFQDNSPEIMLH